MVREEGRNVPLHTSRRFCDLSNIPKKIISSIFQGLAIAMMFGAVAATALTLIAVPLLYYEYFKGKPCPLRTEDQEEGNAEKI
jgi:hypothetical protein